jgi:hypothetical protein
MSNFIHNDALQSGLKKLLIILFLAMPIITTGQSWKTNPFSVSLFNNATMLPPASIIAIFNQPIHPGVTLSYEFGWKEGQKHKWFQNAGISYMYQRYVYQSILLNTQAGYRFRIKSFSIEGYLQAGYMHAFYLSERAVQKDDGTYVSKQGAGKPQFIMGAGIGFGYDFGKEKKVRRIILGYDFRIQTPFVKSYVTFLPNGALYIGFQFNFK